MKRISVKGHANAPAEAVYELLRDGSTWTEWAPFDSFEIVEEGDAERLGEVHVFRTGRHVTRERIVELVPNRRYAYELLAGPPLRDYRAYVDLEPDDTGTLIHWHSSFRPGRPGTGWIYRNYLSRFIGRCLTGLAERASATASA
ncbi:MAG TPA: SRPBCC family protein [Streptosporangiaceae bacterium]|jgi:uncharacterized protein YndB with AHSA1/START domain